MPSRNFCDLCDTETKTFYRVVMESDREFIYTPFNFDYDMVCYSCVNRIYNLIKELRERRNHQGQSASG